MNYMSLYKCVYLGSYNEAKKLIEEGNDEALDKFVNNPDVNIRALVAKYGRDKDLDVLVHDHEIGVRFEVAKHGRPQDLDILINDYDENIVNEVKRVKELGKDECKHDMY